MFLTVIETVLYIIVVVVSFSQVIIPAWRGEPMFPMFWSKETKLQVQLSKLTLQEREQLLEEEVFKRQATIFGVKEK